MEIIILGSSAAIPIKERNLPSIALKYKNELILFDCGEDLQRRLNQAGLKFNKPLNILISHFHWRKNGLLKIVNWLYSCRTIRQKNVFRALKGN